MMPESEEVLENREGGFGWRLDHAPVHVRMFVTIFLCVVGLGMIAAQVNLFLQHRYADGDPAFSMKDIVGDLHGRPGQRSFTQAVRGNMREYLETEEEVETVIAWSEADGLEQDYHLQIADIISERCIICHSPGGEAEQLPLTSYEEVIKSVKPAWLSPSPERIAKLIHIHILGLASLWMIVGCITLFSGPTNVWRSLLAAMPLVGITMDAIGMCLAPLAKPFVWLTIGGGALMGIAFVCQFFLVMYSLWYPRR